MVKIRLMADKLRIARLEIQYNIPGHSKQRPAKNMEYYNLISEKSDNTDCLFPAEQAGQD